MKLTKDAQAQLNFSSDCYMKGLVTAKKYLEAVKSIYHDDVERQITLLVEQGFTYKGAIRNIFDLDKEAICQ